MEDTKDPTHLAAGRIPIGVFLAANVAIEAGASIEIFIEGDPSVGGRRKWGGNAVRAHLSKSARPEAVAKLKAAGFRWAGNQWRWLEGR